MSQLFREFKHRNLDEGALSLADRRTDTKTEPTTTPSLKNVSPLGIEPCEQKGPASRIGAEYGTLSQNGYGDYYCKMSGEFLYEGKNFLKKKARRPFGRRAIFKTCELIREKQIRETQEKPQWIVAQRLLSHLQYLDTTKSSAKDLPSAPYTL